MPDPASATLPAPRIQTPPDKWRREYDAFLRLLPELRQAYLDQYVLIHDGQVVASGPDELALAMRFFQQHANVPVHIGLVSERPEPVARVPHYRQARLPEAGT